MNETLIFIDAAFISKLKKYFGNGEYLKTDLIKFSKNLAKKENLTCKEIFYYTAPPFQSGNPTKEESSRYKKYMKFKNKLSRQKIFKFREGRCQRLKTEEGYTYNQKAVDIFLAMDLTNIPIKHPKTKQVILLTSDSDFVPVIENLKQQDIKIILYTYYERKRDVPFSRSNHLIKSVSKYVKLTKENFQKSLL